MEGYARLANLMGNDRSDGHFLIFQKFESLSAQNLLYLQAEIINLQEKLGEQVQEDASSPETEKQLYTRDWDTLGNPGDNRQWATWLEVRELLLLFVLYKSARVIPY